MKKLYFLSVILLVSVFVSCKKGATDLPLGTFSANIDGTTTTFEVSAKASVLSVQNGYGIGIFGYKKDPSISGTSLNIEIVRPTPITAGSYIENTADNPLVQMNYFYDAFLGAGVGYSNFHSSTNPITVTVTDVSSTSIKGTFQGVLDGGLSNGTITITNGVFYVSF